MGGQGTLVMEGPSAVVEQPENTCLAEAQNQCLGNADPPYPILSPGADWASELFLTYIQHTQRVSGQARFIYLFVAQGMFNVTMIIVEEEKKSRVN